MQKITEPLWVGVDVDAIKAELDAEDRRREARRAGGRRTSPRRSSLSFSIETAGLMQFSEYPASSADLSAHLEATA